MRKIDIRHLNPLPSSDSSLPEPERKEMDSCKIVLQTDVAIEQARRDFLKSLGVHRPWDFR